MSIAEMIAEILNQPENTALRQELLKVQVGTSLHEIAVKVSKVPAIAELLDRHGLSWAYYVGFLNDSFHLLNR